MAYATISDVVMRYRPIRTAIGSGESYVASVDVASVYIAQAESFVDGYIGLRYVTPLNVVPPLITMVCADLSLFYMMTEKVPQVPEFMDDRYKRCMDILEKLRDGKMTLSTSVTVVSSRGDSYAWSSTMDYHPVFSPVLNPEDQRVDNDRVTADKDARSADTPAIDDDDC